jgi:Ni,Fe-hydrogenase I large subunit
MARIAIDPVSRAGGQLRIEAELAGGKVGDAWSSGTMFRGIELVLHGRDPRDAWLLAERICGSCTTVHALASVRAVERALAITIPTNARLVRNLLASTALVRDHVLSIYTAQVPDWVDTASALTADPAATAALARATSDWSSSGEDRFAFVQARLAAAASPGLPGPFDAGFPGHPAYALEPEANLLLLSHLLDALEWQRELMRIHVLLGGKDPHPQTYLVGGMSLAPPWGGPIGQRNRDHPDVPHRNSPDPLSPEGLDFVGKRLATARTFVEQVLVPDVRMLVKAYPEWASLGAGPGNYLAYGDYPQDDTEEPKLLLPRGAVVHTDPAKVGLVDPDRITESVDHAWYHYDTISERLQPAEGQTSPAFDAASLPLTALDGDGRYSWLKAPRYEGLPMETGPLARVMVGYLDGRGEIAAALGPLLTGLGVGPEVMPSVLGRILARAVEADVLTAAAIRWLGELRENLATGDVAVADITAWDPDSWPEEAASFSLGEGPRGAVGHWVSIRGKTVDSYQVVDGSTWNASPRDGSGIRGPLEAALVGIPVADPNQPLEVLRVVHSFGPCVACAAHVFGPLTGAPLAIHTWTREAGR